MFVRTRNDEAGFISVEIMIAVALSLLFLVYLLNLLFLGYGKAVLRVAADEGARAGSRISVAAPADGAAQNNAEDVSLSIAACSERARTVMESLGEMATRPLIECTVDPAAQRVDVNISATLERWIPPIPNIDVKETASATKETGPQ